ncbi:MAG TPA: NADP-dependent oxidoreductase [Gryllotalpicola sp.]
MIASGTVVQYTRYGGADVLELAPLSVDAPGAGEVAVAIRAAGVNPVDWKVRSGWRSSGRPLEGVARLGLDAAGTVIASGEGVTAFAPGDDVIGFDLPWSYATHVVASAALFTAKPAGVGFEEGAAIGVPVGTAYQVLSSLGLRNGETALVHAGAGAVGQAVIQLAVLRGARVIATAGPSNQSLLAELGAEPVTYGDGLLDRLRALAPRGVDLVVEGAGTQEALEASLALVHDRRRIGEIVNRRWREEYGIRAWSASAPGYLSDEEIRVRHEAMPLAAALASEGRLRLTIARRMPLASAAEAHRLSETGHAQGKTALVPSHAPSDEPSETDIRESRGEP